MPTKKLIAVAVIAMAMSCAGLMSMVITPANVDARLVPDHWREDRWEMSSEGRQARDLAESLCGVFPDGAWLDRPGHVGRTVIRGASDTLSQCFETKVRPAMRAVDPLAD